MSQLDQFLQRLEGDSDTRREIRLRIIDQLVEIGSEHGYAFTRDDVREFFPNGSFAALLTHARKS